MPFNHSLFYSAIRGGTAIINPNVNEFGTAGLIATSNGSDRWIISAYHVLCRKNGIFPAGVSELIYYATDLVRTQPLAMVDGLRADAALDCAAAFVVGGVAIGEILGLPKLQPAIAPLEGMRVLKSGAQTGVTEGRIVRQNAQQVEIAPVGMPARFELSEGGDSGAVWIDADTRAPVALHTSGNSWGDPERAFGVPILLVLQTLNLQMVVP